MKYTEDDWIDKAIKAIATVVLFVIVAIIALGSQIIVGGLGISKF